MRKFYNWYGLSTIKESWSGDKVDGQSRDILCNDKSYDDSVHIKMYFELSRLAEQDGYITDGWHKVPYEEIAKRHEKELVKYLEDNFTPDFVKADMDIDDWNCFVLWIDTEDGVEL